MRSEFARQVLREERTPSFRSEITHMTHEELIDALVSKKLLSDAAALRLKRDLSRGDASLDTLISREHLVDDAELAKTKSELLKVPYKKVVPDTIDAALFTLLP